MTQNLGRFLAILILCLGTIGLIGCGDDDGGSSTATDVASDVQADTSSNTNNPLDCTGIDECSAEGLSRCNGESILSCSVGSNGCLVENVQTSCGTGENCVESGGSATCDSPCAGEDDTALCDSDGATQCAGDMLQSCAANAKGCLLWSDTSDCATEADVNTCNDGITGAQCVFDACLGQDDCTPGSACSGTSLTLCSIDASGCLVSDTVACDLDEVGNTCESVDGTDLCVAAGGDPCVGVAPADLCDVEGNTCDDASTISSCVPNAFGCLVLEQTDCTAAIPDGVCNDGPAPFCGIAPNCSGKPSCDTEGTACAADGNTLTSCGFDAEGCLVEMSQNCSDLNADFICNEGSDGESVCGLSCSDQCDVDGADTCVDNNIWTCSSVGGCLDWVETQVCGAGEFCTLDGADSGICGTNGTGDACGDVYFSSEYPFILAGADFNADFTDTMTAQGDECTNSAGPEFVLGLNLLADEWIHLRETGAVTAGIQVQEACGDTLTCEPIFGSSGNRGWAYSAAADKTVFASYEFSTGSSSTDYEIQADKVVFSGIGTFDVGQDIPDTISSDLLPSGESVFYSITFNQGVTADITVTGDSGDIDVFLYKLDGQFIESDAGFGDEILNGVEMSAGTYVLWTYAYSSSDDITGHTISFSTSPGPECGDGILDTTDVCDDGNLIDGDGCSATCTIETGFACSDTDFSTCYEVVCGDGFIDGEACDDGNAIDGDGCTATCQVEADFACSGEPSFCFDASIGATCDAAIPISAGTWGPFVTTAYTGDYDDYNGTCGSNKSGAGPDMAFSVEVPDGGILDVVQNDDGPNSFDGVLVIATDCADIVNSCVSYGDFPEEGTWVNETGAPQTVFIIADGYFGTSDGEFTLDVTIRIPVCGDGVLDAGEGCDDGNLNDADGCDVNCVVEPSYICTGSPSVCFVPGPGDSCGDPVPLDVGISGPYDTTTGYSDLYDSYRGGCYTSGDSGLGNDAVFSIEVAAGDELNAALVNVSAGYNVGLHLISDCADPLGTCVDVNDAVTYYNETGAPQTVFLIVDSTYSFTEQNGTFELDINMFMPVCGDSDIGPAETCDDGNDIGGDGCASDCTIETGFLCSGVPSVCVPTVCGDGVIEGIETCDDGNADFGDGCDSECLLEDSYICSGSPSVCFIPGPGDSCGDPVPVEMGLSGPYNTNIGYTDIYDSYRGSCYSSGNSGFGNDAVFSVEVGDGEQLNAALANVSPGYNVGLHLVSDCADPLGTCVEVNESVEYFNNTGVPQTLFLIVDSTFAFTEQNGTFELDVNVSVPFCGDGLLSPLETCDDGNNIDGDGCAADCTPEVGFTCTEEGGVAHCYLDGVGETCLDAIPIAAGTWGPYANNTYANDYTGYNGDCGTSKTAAGPDIVFSVEVPDGGILNVVQNDDGADSFDGVLVISTDCGDVINSCASYRDTPEDGTWLNETGAPQTVFIIADAWSSSSLGDFTLDVDIHVPICGDGILEVGEACDDGNPDTGDGCDAACLVEPGFGCAGEPSVCVDTSIGDTCAAAIDLDGMGGAGNYGPYNTSLYANDYGPFNDTVCNESGTLYSTSGNSSDVVFSITVPAGQTLTAAVTSPSYDGVVALLTDCDVIDMTTCWASDDPEPSTTSYDNTLGVDDQVIYIIVDGYGSSAGEFTLDVTMN